VKTLALRLDDDLHVQLQSVALLGRSTVSDVIRSAIRRYIAEEREALRDKAQAALVDIEKAAADRRAALDALFDDGTPQPD
jgi:predicted transcriptional regulator